MTNTMFTALTKLSDIDGDGLIDGDEVNIHSTDPLVVDLDADSDGYYCPKIR